MNTPIDPIDRPLPLLAGTPLRALRALPPRGFPAAPPPPGLPTEPAGPPAPRILSCLDGGVLSVGLAGEFDHHGCLPLRALLDDGAALGARRLVLEAARVTFCDSALARLLDRWSGTGRSWELASASRAVRLLLDLWARLGRAAGPP
ncbi:STAS domain-containing protein [Streptomyces sp. NPDC001389]|uniref:STAS domain-containing protein n=1 Tax=Streptomyces sp. NPDC001389 TaxID=3364569 RepID=UPI0036C8FC67